MDVNDRGRQKRDLATARSADLRAPREVYLKSQRSRADRFAMRARRSRMGRPARCERTPMRSDSPSELDALRARVRALEVENARLLSASPFGNWTAVPGLRPPVARAHASYEDLSRSFAAMARALARTRQHLAAKLEELAEESAGHREVLRRLERSQAALDGIASMVVWLRPSAHFAYVNEAACRRLGYCADDFQRLLLTDIDPQVGPDELDAMWARMRETGSATVRSLLRTLTGETIPVTIHASYFARQDERLAFCFVEDLGESPARELPDCVSAVREP